MPKNQSELIIRLARVRNNFRPYTLSAILAVLISVSAWSQTQLATASGTITDPTGAVVPGVLVTIVSQGTGLKRSTPTDTGGEYRFAGLPTGTYSLRIEKKGFQSHVRKGLELSSASEVRMNLQLAIGDVSKQTTVNASAGAIDSTTSTVQGPFPEESLADLSLDNRDLFSAVKLEPGVAPNPTVLRRCFLTVRLGKCQLMAYVRV
jgi:hypothetical protein